MAGEALNFGGGKLQSGDPADCDGLSLFPRVKLELREMSPALDPFETMLETLVEPATQNRPLV